MEKAIAAIVLISGLCFALSDGPNGPGIVNFFGAIGFLCGSIWIGNIIAEWSIKNG